MSRRLENSVAYLSKALVLNACSLALRRRGHLWPPHALLMIHPPLEHQGSSQEDDASFGLPT
jgi:hypothetical protein